MLSLHRAFRLAALLLTISAAATAGESGDAAKLEFFEKQVRPLLAKHCYSCHSTQAKKLQAALLLDSRRGLLKGGETGPAIVPGDPDASLLMKAVRYESNEMPPKGKLPAEDIATLERWIRNGAPWPDEAEPTAATHPPMFDLQERKRSHWAWQPVQSPPRPAVKNASWPRDDIDNFVLSALEEKHLSPAIDADRLAILRRTHMDLVGLPPTVEQIQKFESDRSDRAVEKVVDELLASPQFGERWARHWLDLVRYAESRGHEFDNDIPNAFQYRDYVIRALNADVPYDQFVREHIAGDLLPQPRLHPTQKFNESVLGTGFWFMGEWAHSPVDIRKDEADRFDNMVDVFAKTFLGVTVACARCHDHKFDAISSADYYALTGFLQSSDYRQVRFETLEQDRETARLLAELDTRFQRQLMGLLDAQGIRPPASEQPKNAAVVIDYGRVPPQEFMQNGFLFGAGPRTAGLPYLNAAGQAIEIATCGTATSDPFWNGMKSINEGLVQDKSSLVRIPGSGRTLRTETFELKHGDVACLVQGRGHVVACVDSHRLVAGPLHGETIHEIKAGDHWTRLNLQRYIGHRLHLEFVPAENAQLSVRLVVQGLDAEDLQNLDRQLAEFDRPNEEFAKAAESLFNGPNATASQIIQAWKKERDQLRARVVLESRTAPAMFDGSGEDDHVLIRGDVAKPGPVEPRHFLTAITGGKSIACQRGSGRLQLAEQINDPANPLTSRVFVNRVWHHLMGRGIVATTDDFGVLGQRPTHPELLDHLATRFVAQGRSLKTLIKSIVLSRSYQMSTNVDPRAATLDPDNLFWHHLTPARLEGEVIRDSLLALSGRLDPTKFGPPVPIHLTSFMDGRGRPGRSGPLDGDGRRSIYISVRRNFLSPFMLAFDTPVPFSAMGRRNVSNVPAQSLILMNDPFVAEQARGWANQALKASDNTAGRVDWMYLTAFTRRPTDAEREIALQFLGENPDHERWADFAHILINTKEFIFLR